MRPERHGPLHGRRRQPGQHRCVVRPRVRHAALVVAIPESPAIEQALDPRLHGGQHLRHVQGREATCGVKIQGAGTVPREDAVQHERVDVDVQIEGSPEPLDHGHRAPTTIRDAAVARERAGSRARRGRTRRRPRDTGRDSTPAGTAGGTADSGPTAARARRGTRDRAGGRLARPSGGRRNLDRHARALHENGTSRSRPQSPQRNRANPPASQPHCRKFRNSCSTNRGRPSPSRRHAACTRKVSK